MYVRFRKNEISGNDKIMGLINKYVGGKTAKTWFRSPEKCVGLMYEAHMVKKQKAIHRSKISTL